jgi:hypothetical protein
VSAIKNPKERMRRRGKLGTELQKVVVRKKKNEKPSNRRRRRRWKKKKGLKGFVLMLSRRVLFRKAPLHTETCF